jgi:hypothetical protein
MSVAVRTGTVYCHTCCRFEQVCSVFCHVCMQAEGGGVLETFGPSHAVAPANFCFTLCLLQKHPAIAEEGIFLSKPCFDVLTSDGLLHEHW